MSEDTNKNQKYLLLNVPARQSRNYYDYIQSNIDSGNLVFVDALFGGLDVAARFTANSGKVADAIKEELASLIEKKNFTKESAILKLSPFIDKTEIGVQENFMIVFMETDEDMRESSHQNSLISYMDRHKVAECIRFGAVVEASSSLGALPIPMIVEKYRELMDKGRLVVLEITVQSLNDPRNIVMRRIQNFSDVVSTRTFFGVNFAKTDQEHRDPEKKGWLTTIKEWASPLLNLKRLFGL